MRYNLTTKCNEIICKCEARTMSDAIEFFSQRKGLSNDDLLDIYWVIEE